MGIKLVWMGFSLAILLAVIKNKLGGLAEIANVIQISSDVLSYLRLYALGLAGGMMSSTFNSIGNSVPIYVGFLIIIVGHLVIIYFHHLDIGFKFTLTFKFFLLHMIFIPMKNFIHFIRHR